MTTTRLTKPCVLTALLRPLVRETRAERERREAVAAELARLRSVSPECGGAR